VSAVNADPVIGLRVPLSTINFVLACIDTNKLPNSSATHASGVMRDISAQAQQQVDALNAPTAPATPDSATTGPGVETQPE
jgi:hypothetical protein